MAKMYRIRVVIEAYNSISELKDDETIPAREWVCQAITDNRKLAMQRMSDALEVFGDDPLFGDKTWEA